MKNNFVRIIVYENNLNFINKLIHYNIYYEDLIKEKEYYILTISYENYKIIKRHYNCEILRYYGKNFLINFVKNNKYMLISLMISLFILKMLSNTIFKVNINTSDDRIYNIVYEYMQKNNIKEYKRKKSFQELQIIKEKILKDNKDDLEWIEISEKGCIYNIDITKRVKKEKEKTDLDASDIVAYKDGKIMFIAISSGTALKEKNDYVKKGEVLISGNVKKGDKTIYQVKSSGVVYAEVWYTVKVVIPFKYTEYVDTGKIINHYYLDVFGKEFTLIGKYNINNTINKRKLILDKVYLPFRLYKEEKRKYEYREFNITKEEAYKEALKRSDSKIQNILKDDEYIISKNVLKKDVFSSKIEVEVFYKVYENIARSSKIIKKDE